MTFTIKQNYCNFRKVENKEKEWPWGADLWKLFVYFLKQFNGLQDFIHFNELALDLSRNNQTGTKSFDQFRWQFGFVLLKNTSNLTKWMGSGCGSVSRAVASDTRDLRFESRHRQKFIYQLYNRKRKKENKAGNGPSLKKHLTRWIKVSMVIKFLSSWCHCLKISQKEY